MTIDTLRFEMVAAIKARDKKKQEIIAELTQKAKEAAFEGHTALPDQIERLILAECKRTKECLLVAPAGREDIKDQLRIKVALLEEYLKRIEEEKHG
ncbi:MAG: GatB/YqeY domain-containing protein [Lachnospiraceae bacterium]|nr:GatB/YqeY domain-containing protein [Lachnospiraceae bacterium]